MTEDHEHEADAPEQEISSDASELIHQEAQNTAEAAPSTETEEGTSETVDGDDESDAASKPRPPRKLERLQKILAQAGIASRRHAEEMITEGRVQVNGKVVTELGSKADAAQDHIRVDGKLLHGAERQRYFMLNKPRGFVTTVKDPEGRATVMKFFEKMPERLYPVGRLDYLSEGLLLVTNDGELANKLTKAASGVEKTYLVKVSGQPTEDQLDILRGGVSIPRGKAGEDRVRTAPARIRQVRQGDNPWYEVVLVEGRNRELRKMFEEIGHFVEKIRRVGYGPLVLDLEPGMLRELDAEELTALRRVAEGKVRTPKAKDLRRRNAMDAQLPTLPPRPSRPRPVVPVEGRTPEASRPEFRPKPAFGADRPFRPTRPAGKEFRPSGRDANRESGRGTDRPSATGPARTTGAARFGAGRPTGRPAVRNTDRPASRPAWKKDDRPARPSAPPTGRTEWKKDAGSSRTFPGRPTAGKPDFKRPASGSRSGPPAKNFAPRGDRPAFNRPASNRPAPSKRETPPESDTFVPRKVRLQIDSIEPDRPTSSRPTSSRPPFERARPDRPRPEHARPERPKFDREKPSRPSSGRASSTRPAFGKPGFKPGFKSGARPSFDRPKFDRSASDRPKFDRPKFDRPKFDRPRTDRSDSSSSATGRTSAGRSGTGHYGSTRPPRPEGLARPFTTSSGKPRPGGARPSSKPGGKAGWKPKPSFGGSGKQPSGGGARPKSGGFSKSAFKGKSGGAKRTGPRPGGKRPGGPSGGKRRG